MKRLILIFIFVLTIAIVPALSQEQSPFSPYPGGSPFPPGGEPFLTHTVAVYWTTHDGMSTEIRITSESDRPTQLDCWKVVGGKKDIITNSIAPDCRYHILMSAKKSEVAGNIRNMVAQGHGEIEVRVYGFKQEDFKNPPVVNVSYLKKGKIVGQTRVTAAVIPKNLTIK